MLDVNATAPTLIGMGEAKVVSSVGGGTMGREVLPLLSAPWTCPASSNHGCFAGQHSFLLGCLVGGTSTINFD